MERVALAENLNYTGVVYEVYEKGSYDDLMEEMCHVQWDKFGKYLYPISMLVSEKEAQKKKA